MGRGDRNMRTTPLHISTDFSAKILPFDTFQETWVTKKVRIGSWRKETKDHPDDYVCCVSPSFPPILSFLLLFCWRKDEWFRWWAEMSNDDNSSFLKSLMNGTHPAAVDCCLCSDDFVWHERVDPEFEWKTYSFQWKLSCMKRPENDVFYSFLLMMIMPFLEFSDSLSWVLNK